MQNVGDWMDEFGPEKMICVHDTRWGMKGYIVVDNTARGPAKGGTRLAPDVTLWDVFRLARTMTWKWAIADCPVGGAKAGIVCDPKNPNKEQVIRAFCRAVREYVPEHYVCGIDVGMKEEDSAIILDEFDGTYSKRGTIGGLGEFGGADLESMGPCGCGVAEATEAGVKYINKSIKDVTVSIHGFGNVGTSAAKYLGAKGAKIVAVSNIEGGLYDPHGLDVSEMLRLVAKFGDEGINQYREAKKISGQDALTVDADVLIPAATQDVITEDNVDNIKAGLIVEGANMPTTEKCQEILHERGVLIIPDFVANAGAIIFAASILMPLVYQFDVRTTSEEMESIVQPKMRNNVTMVLDEVRESKRLPREVALAIAKNRVLRAMKLKGRIPR
jgi:glutamate dehydrogenase (NAD(P)+)